MKNLKKLAFGLMVGALAIGSSALTANANRATGDIYVNNGNGTYTLTTNFDPTNCASSTDQCAYRQISTGTFSSTVPASTVQNTTNFTPQGTSKGIYSQP